MDFRIVGGLDGLETCLATIASATVIEAGDLVELNSGLIVKAGATAAAVAYAPYGSKAGETKIEISVGNNFMLEGTGDGNFAVAYKGTAVDLAGTTNQLIDVTGGTTYQVLKFDVSENAGTVGSKDNIRVKINKPLI